VAAAAENSGAATITALTKLRMFCTHPWLADSLRDVPDAAQCSVKFSRLLEILEEIISEGGNPNGSMQRGLPHEQDFPLRTAVAERQSRKKHCCFSFFRQNGMTFYGTR
jgi:hypothetical protein